VPVDCYGGGSSVSGLTWWPRWGLRWLVSAGFGVLVWPRWLLRSTGGCWRWLGGVASLVLRVHRVELVWVCWCGLAGAEGPQGRDGAGL
jgi:hypothetical protein